MRRYKPQNVLCVLLAMAMISSAFPWCIVEDADKDSRIDLKDAVLNAQSIKPGDKAAHEKVEACISAMQVVAQIKNIPASSCQVDKIFFVNLCFLLSAMDPGQFLTPSGKLADFPVLYSSITFPPLVLPPIG